MTSRGTTMGPGEPPRSSLERFAADHLGLPPELAQNPVDLKQRLYRELEQDDFLPDPLSHEAILLLSGGPIRQDAFLYQGLVRTREQRLKAAIDEFAVAFFSLPPTERVERWEKLAEACGGSHPLLHRLQALKPGLELQKPSLEKLPPLVQAVTNDVFELFTLGPLERVRESRQRATLRKDEAKGRTRELATALRHVRRHYEKINQTVETYLRDLATTSGFFLNVPRPLVDSKNKPISSTNSGGGCVGFLAILGVSLGITILLVWLVPESPQSRVGFNGPRTNNANTRYYPPLSRTNNLPATGQPRAIEEVNTIVKYVGQLKKLLTDEGVTFNPAIANLLAEDYLIETRQQNSPQFKNQDPVKAYEARLAAIRKALQKQKVPLKLDEEQIERVANQFIDWVDQVEIEP